MKRYASIALIMALIVAGCGEDPAPYDAPEPFSLSMPVKIVAVEDVPSLYTVPGKVRSDERLAISSRITGFIQAIPVEEGQQISRGEALVSIDADEVEGAIARAKASLQAAQAAHGDAEEDVTRLAGLRKKGFVANETWRKATVRRDVTAASLQEAKAALNTALAGRRYANITSPIDGVIVARHQRVGDMAAPGMPILTIESRQQLVFRTAVSEDQIQYISKGDVARLQIDALEGDALEGVVMRVVTSGDAVTHRYDVDIALPDVPGLLAGMFGRVSFVIGAEQATLVPQSAIVERGGLQGVFVLDAPQGDTSLSEGSQARFRWVRLGAAGPEGVIVTAGLEPGEVILTEEDHRIRDGDMVRVVLKAALYD
jgi:RND family efflux transporter MFP subunit